MGPGSAGPVHAACQRLDQILDEVAAAAATTVVAAAAAVVAAAAGGKGILILSLTCSCPEGRCRADRCRAVR